MHINQACLQAIYRCRLNKAEVSRQTYAPRSWYESELGSKVSGIFIFFLGLWVKILPARSTCGTPSLAQSTCRPEELLFLHPCLIRLAGVGCGSAVVGRCCRRLGPGGRNLGGAPCLCARSWSGGEERKKVKWRREGSLGGREEKWEEAARWRSASQTGGGWVGEMATRSVRKCERMGLALLPSCALCWFVRVCQRGGVGCQLWWSLGGTPQQQVPQCSPHSSSLPPCLLHHSPPLLPLSCRHHWRIVQAPLLQRQYR